jgi:mRNA-degrading endonuclease RelE of RelBE toxin-antitoxin system
LPGGRLPGLPLLRAHAADQGEGKDRPLASHVPFRAAIRARISRNSGSFRSPANGFALSRDLASEYPRSTAARRYSSAFYADGQALALQGGLPAPRLTRRSAIVTILVTVVRRQRYTLVYAPKVKRHVRAIGRRHFSMIRQTLEEQLLFEPDTETRNRKPLRPPAALEAQWELRCGPDNDNKFRVFYEIDRENRNAYILAIGVKERDRLYIGGEEVDL